MVNDILNASQTAKVMPETGGYHCKKYNLMLDIRSRTRP